MKFVWMWVVLLAIITTGCETAKDDRIPSMPVSIDLTGQGIWNTWGVHGYGDSRRFILYKSSGQAVIEPAGFNYAQNAATGYGGVLLIGGMDPYTGEPNVPLAYDLSCPVECSPIIRVNINPENYTAVCPKCHSVYNVTDAGGAPISGEAVAEKYRLRRYACIPGNLGGYLIINQ